MIDSSGMCDRTGKQQYSYKVAHLKVKVCKRFRCVHKVPIRFYRCDFCGWWHLTSQEKESKNGKRQIRRNSKLDAGL